MADQQGVIRKLAAILYADVAGYSRLTGVDEEGTHRTVADYLDSISELVSAHRGRVVHYAGDAVLAEFPSVVAAVKCAVEIQKELAARNTEIPEDRKVQFRIGVNLGDVIVDRDDIYGNGVNVAARLEGLADPGGICVSGSVLEQVQDKVDVGFEDMGPQEVKNIAKPVQTYRVVLELPVNALPQLSLPDKPSIAVLPFDNLGGNPAQDFLGEGIAEDIITELSRFHSLFVIARGSSFSFKDQSLDTREIAKKLGVRYVLEGSVRTLGSRIRITAQLIDAEHAQHLWSERYDRETEDLFALQDEITGVIVRIIEPTVNERERQRARLNAPNHLDAWTLFQKGMTHYYGATANDYDMALISFRDATHADPDFAAAFAMRADTFFRQALHGKPKQRGELLAKGLADAETAICLDPRDARSHYALGRVKTLLLESDAALLSIDKALELNPNFAMALFARGYVIVKNDPANALDYFDRAKRLSPYDPMYSAFLNLDARIYFFLERFDKSVEAARLACQYPNPRIWPFLFLAMALGKLQRHSEAQAVLQDCLLRFPGLNLAHMEAATAHYNSDDRSTILRELRDLGLPE